LDLAGTSLLTTSAFLDLLTREQIDDLAAACAEAGCPALLTLSVTGEVEFTPGEPLDAEFTAAFIAHQRRAGLLGPDAITAADDAFERHGARVHRARCPCGLGPDHPALIQGLLSA